MSIKATENEILAAKVYQDLHVPALFKQFSPVVVKAAEITLDQRVLDIACGTGTLAQEAAKKVGSNGFIAGLDVAPGMLVVASQLNQSIDWKQGVAESLPYDDNSFDAVVSQFGLMFFQDRIKAIKEMLRVLSPGGKLAIAVWDSLQNSDAYREEVALLDQIAGQHAADALRAPFELGEIEVLAKIFNEAGVDSIEIITHHGTARFPDIETMVEADLRGWLPIMGVELTEDQISTILKEAEQVLHKYITKDGTIRFNAPAHIVTGCKP